MRLRGRSRFNDSSPSHLLAIFQFQSICHLFRFSLCETLYQRKSVRHKIKSRRLFLALGRPLLVNAEQMASTSRHFTLAEYLAYEDDTDTHYELVNGELVEMHPESDENNLIAIYLIVTLSQIVPLQQIRRGTELVVSGIRTTVRVPDLMVLSEELAMALAGAPRSTVLPDMPPPALVVEIVSPSRKYEERDYRYKRSEYAARGISEYWIIDPKREHLVMLSLVAGLYEAAVYKGCDRILSPLFPHLDLTAEHVLRAKL